MRTLWSYGKQKYKLYKAIMATVPDTDVTQPVFFGKASYTLAVKLSDVTV
jgi:hypothetical protein